MNRMKQLIFVVIGFIIAGLVIAGLLNVTKNDIRSQVSENNEKTSSIAVKEHEDNEKTLVFLCLHQDAGSETFSAYVVNKNGKRFDIDLSKNKRDISQYEEIFKDAQSSFEDSEGKDFIGSRDIENLCELLRLAKPSKEFTTETDPYGTHGVTIVYGAKYTDDKLEILKIGQAGDTKQIPSDTNASSILKYFAKKSA